MKTLPVLNVQWQSVEFEDEFDAAPALLGEDVEFIRNFTQKDAARLVELANQEEYHENIDAQVDDVANFFNAHGLDQKTLTRKQLSELRKLYGVVTKAQVEAAGDRLGWDVDREWVEEVVAGYKDVPTQQLKGKLSNAVRKFKELGGRGVELADEIDAMRAALAVRRVKD